MPELNLEQEEIIELAEAYVNWFSDEDFDEGGKFMGNPRQTLDKLLKASDCPVSIDEYINGMRGW